MFLILLVLRTSSVFQIRRDASTDTSNHESWTVQNDSPGDLNGYAPSPSHFSLALSPTDESLSSAHRLGPLFHAHSRPYPSTQRLIVLGPQRSKDVRVLIPYADLSSASPPFALDDFMANPHPPSRPPLLKT
ncbi:hypothetical protein Landi51_11244 [Colletotrichum acutatum]